MAAEYFQSFVCGCGMPDTPVERGGVWSVRLRGGYLLKGKVIVYKHVEHWSLQATGFVEKDLLSAE